MQEEKEAKAKWVFDEAGNWFWTKALAYNGEIWVGCLDHKVYALNALSGEKTCDFETDGRVRTPPVLVKEQIIVGSEDGNLHAFDTNENKWYVLRSLEAPILAPICPDAENGAIYVHAQNGSHILYAINVETGENIWSPYHTEIEE